MAKKPTNADLINRIAELERSYVPRQLDTVADPRNQPADTLATVSADRVHAAIIQAEQGDTRELFALYRDCLASDAHLQGLIETRFLAVLGDDPTAQAASDAAEDQAAAVFIQGQMTRCHEFSSLAADLLWGTMWPVALVERTYRPSDEPGVTYDIGDIAPVPDHLLRWTVGALEVGAIDQQTRQPNGIYSRPDPARYIIHRGHLLSSKLPDTWGGPMRALMWWWLLKTQDRDWWARFLDKFGTPFTVAKVEKSDDRSRQILERALKLSYRIGGLVVSTGTQVELQQANTAAADAHEKFYKTCEDAQARRILGQTLSSSASPTGMGAGTSKLQGEVRSDIRAFDKKWLNATFRQQVFAPLMRLNGIKGQPPNLVWGGEEPEENSVTATVLASLKMAGLRIGDKSMGDLSKRIGLMIERDPSPAGPAPAGTAKLLSAGLPRAADPDAAAGSISREAAASITQAYRGSLAPVAQLILSAATPEEATTRLLAAFTDWDVLKVAEVVETALVAGAWNGVQV
jgi:phage gp29-like protein